ncbi:hypothetical protein M9Y10_045011 [Tritrichomonas musculus]|uniref:Uncharacterized protein n=1 Tax=Tritrichomonas musculus TaxID=1915356 RepID=A0ABR2JUF0_9EUKA
MATRIEIINELYETFENEEYLYDETSYDEYQEDEYQEDDQEVLSTIYMFFEYNDINKIKCVEDIMKNLPEIGDDEDCYELCYNCLTEKYSIYEINEKLLTLNDENKVEFIEKIIRTMF